MFNPKVSSLLYKVSAGLTVGSARSISRSMQQYIEQQENPQNIWPAPDRNTPEGVRTQTAGYARDVLSNGLPRRHVHSFIVDSTFVRGIFYDHSVLTSSYLCLRQYTHYISSDHCGVCGMFTLFFMSLSFSTLIIRC